jgi:SAM-dependent methyltransferase
LETVACNLCGSERHTAVYQMPDRLFFPNEFFTVVACDQCGLGFVNPRPTISEMKKYYPLEYHQGAPTPGYAQYLLRRFAAEAKYLQPLETGGGRKRLLDVGCGTGEFPRFMAARGWDVEGVEISLAARGISDFRVYAQEFHEIPVEHPVYDAVTAWAVLEHVHDPRSYFQKAARVLKPSGLFVFLVTNFHSTASRHLFCEDVPRHLYFFTRETVARYLDAAGFALIQENNGRDIYKMAPVNWLTYMLRKGLGKAYNYRDVPLTSKEFRRVHHLEPGLAAAVKYAVYSPASVLDRMLWPVLEAAQVLAKSYGISTFVARKAS